MNNGGGGEKVYTESQHEMLIAIARVDTMQHVYNEAFKDHEKDNEDHFDRLYDADKKILDEIAGIPTRMAECSEKIKTETLSVARREFATKVENTEVKGSIRTNSILLGVFQAILIVLLGVWLKSKGLG